MTRSTDLAEGQAPSAPPFSTAMTTQETASSAVAAQAQATVQARYVMALQRPRQHMEVRAKLMVECKRSRFAEVAQYKLNFGQDPVTGLSIRFAEAARRAMTNILCETATVYEDREKRIVRVMVTDLEAVVTDSRDATIYKTTEKKFLKRGQIPISSRVNSSGETVHTVDIDESSLMRKEGAQIAKVKRSLIISMLPGDLVDEALEEIAKTKRAEFDRDPKTVIKKMVDGFARFSVAPSDLSEYLGYDVDKVDAETLEQLRGIYTEMKDGVRTWRDVMAEKEESETKKSDEPDERVTAKAAELRTALEKAGSVEDLMKVAKQIRNLPKDIAEELRELYAVRKAEFKEAAKGKEGDA